MKNFAVLAMLVGVNVVWAGDDVVELRNKKSDVPGLKSKVPLKAELSDSSVKVRVDVELRGVLTFAQKEVTILVQEPEFKADILVHVPKERKWVLDLGETKELREKAKSLHGKTVIIKGSAVLLGVKTHTFQYKGAVPAIYINPPITPPDLIGTRSVLDLEHKAVVKSLMEASPAVLPKKAPAQPAAIEAAWADLLTRDQGRSFDAMHALVANPKEATALIKKRMPPKGPITPEELRTIFAGLVDDKFDVRWKASLDLELRLEMSPPKFRKVVQDEIANLDVEPAARCKRILDQVSADADAPGSERLRWLRAIAVLERIYTPEALDLLRSLGEAGDDVRLAREARAALGRLKKAAK